MLFSALIRAKETLDAIALLIKNDLWYQALALLRVLYEIHLNFCFDWIQPETNYKYLAAAAAFSNADIAKQKQELKTEYLADGKSNSESIALADSTWKPVQMATSVIEKSKLSSFGVYFHKDIYDFLSRVSHQNFEMASLHANRFDDETFKAIEDDVKTTYLRFMGFIVTEFSLYLESDIGDERETIAAAV